ncbi:hypothetical protein HDU67_008151, partial [Dinochytrium kinnereticum]
VGEDGSYAECDYEEDLQAHNDDHSKHGDRHSSSSLSSSSSSSSVVTLSIARSSETAHSAPARLTVAKKIRPSSPYEGDAMNGKQVISAKEKMRRKMEMSKKNAGNSPTDPKTQYQRSFSEGAKRPRRPRHDEDDEAVEYDSSARPRRYRRVTSPTTETDDDGTGYIPTESEISRGRRGRPRRKERWDFADHRRIPSPPSRAQEGPLQTYVEAGKKRKGGFGARRPAAPVPASLKISATRGSRSALNYTLSTVQTPQYMAENHGPATATTIGSMNASAGRPASSMRHHSPDPSLTLMSTISATMSPTTSHVPSTQWSTLEREMRDVTDQLGIEVRDGNGSLASSRRKVPQGSLQRPLYQRRSRFDGRGSVAPPSPLGDGRKRKMEYVGGKVWERASVGTMENYETDYETVSNGSILRADSSYCS